MNAFSNDQKTSIQAHYNATMGIDPQSEYFRRDLALLSTLNLWRALAFMIFAEWRSGRWAGGPFWRGIPLGLWGAWECFVLKIITTWRKWTLPKSSE